MEKLQINKELFPVKVHYFLINGAHSGVVPFISVYAKQLGIPADVMGYIYAAICLVTLISRPLFGMLVDHFQKLKVILVSLILLDIVADMGLNFIPSSSQAASNSIRSYQFCHQDRSYLLHLDSKKGCSFCYLDGSYQHHLELCHHRNLTCEEDCVISCTLCQQSSIYCKYNRTLTTKGEYIDGIGRNFTLPSYPSLPFTKVLLSKCNNSEQHSCEEEYLEESTEDDSSLQLWMLGIFTAIIYICMGSIVSLSDAACFNTLGSKPHLYGKQRMWGTIGWGSFALLVGYLNQVFTGTSKIYNFSAGFYMLVALFVTDMMVIPKLRLKKVETSKNICKDVSLLVMKPRVVLFVLQVFSIGVFVGMTRSYLFWHLRTLNASQLVLGCTSAIQCFLGELPFFFLSGWIIKKIGHVNTFTMSFIAHGIKYLSYSFLVDPWWVLPIEILQGPCFGSFYSAMASYAKIVAPKGTEATVQGIAGGTFEGLGVAAGSLLGGYGFRHVGGSVTFFWTGIVSTVIAMLNCVINAALSCKDPISV